MADSWDNLSDQLAGLIDKSQPMREKLLAEMSQSDPEQAKILSKAIKHMASDFLEDPITTHLTNKPKETETLLPGTHLDDFEIESFLGQGGDAKVYRAFQKSLRRFVALKVMERPGHEAQILARLDHSNIVKIFSLHKSENKQLINMQLIEGWTLAEVLRVARKVDDFEQFKQHFDISVGDNSWLFWLSEQFSGLIQALSHAHDSGILHLDMKPSNILVSKEFKMYLVDFGVSMLSVRSKEETLHGGTTKYMSPEQKKALFDENLCQHVDERSDIYSLACVFKELLGHFQRFPLPQTEQSVFNGFEQLVNKAINEDPDSRPMTMQRFGKDFEKQLWNANILKQISIWPALDKMILQHPFWALFWLVLIPQLLGTAYSVVYNYSQIVSGFTPAQAAAFETTMIGYNLFIYPVAVWIYLKLNWEFMQQLFSGEWFQKLSLHSDSESRRKWREKLVTLPRSLLLASSIGWLPGTFMFGICIEWLSTPIAVADKLHFVVSFGFAWLIALSLSHLIMVFLCYGVFYPYFLTGQDLTRPDVRAELNSVLSGNFRYLATGALPLFVSALMIHLGNWQDEFAIKALVTFTLVLGFLGMAASSFVALRLERVKMVTEDHCSFYRK